MRRHKLDTYAKKKLHFCLVCEAWASMLSFFHLAVSRKLLDKPNIDHRCFRGVCIPMHVLDAEFDLHLMIQ